MLSRRGFVGCALCALGGFSATDAGAQSQTPGLKRTILSQSDGPTAGYETIEAKVEIPAGSAVARHTHFGIETAYVIEGELHIELEGVGARPSPRATAIRSRPASSTAARTARGRRR